MALVKAEGREQSCCLSLLGEFWPEQLREVACDPTNISYGLQMSQKSHLDVRSVSQSPWSLAELSSGKDALKRSHAHEKAGGAPEEQGADVPTGTGKQESNSIV